MAKKGRLNQDQIVRDFAAKLRQERQRRGLSQRELAVLAHVNIGYQGKLERGEAAPGIDLVARLAEALEIPPASLLESSRKLPGDVKLKDLVRRRKDTILSRNDMATLEALAVVSGHIVESLARRQV